MPELLWKAYIDFEVTEGERVRARELYERLVQLSGHVKVWIAYAMFEAEPIPIPRAEREEDEDEDEETETPMAEGDPQLARAVFQRGYKDLKGKGLKNEVYLFSRSTESYLLMFYSSASLSSRCGKLSKSSTAPRKM